MLSHICSLLCSVLSSLYPRPMVRPPWWARSGSYYVKWGQGNVEWFSFVSFFFLSTQSLAFITVVLMWICKRQIYDSKMIDPSPALNYGYLLSILQDPAQSPLLPKQPPSSQHSTESFTVYTCLFVDISLSATSFLKMASAEPSTVHGTSDTIGIWWNE